MHCEMQQLHAVSIKNYLTVHKYRYTAIEAVKATSIPVL